MNKQKKLVLILIGIIALAAAVRFYRVTYHDSYTDEAILAFRSIGLIDYSAAYYQTTPWQWLSEVPWWARLSFHDHPIFFFLIQHNTISLFGENMLGVRLPAVLAGIASVLLIYLLGKQLFNQKAGIIAALLLSVQSYHVWVSRLGIQDGMVILFLLLILWLWLQALVKKKWWLWILWGVMLGLGIITKYTVFIIMPILIVHAIIFKHKVYKNKHFWFGMIAVAAVSSPAWLYNLFLYRTFGHFDFQISAFFNQYVEEWQFRQGRQMTGGIWDRFRLFFEALKQADSLWFNFLVASSGVGLVFFAIKKRSKTLLFLLSIIILQILWFLAIGSTLRFVVMIIPFFVLLIAFIFSEIIERIKYQKIGFAVLAMFLVAEFLFTANSFLLSPSWGKKNLTYAEANAETRLFGFNELDDYLNNYLKNKAAGVLGDPKYLFIAELQNKALKKAADRGYEKYPLIIIYDQNLNLMSRLWTFQRRLIYYGWPAMTDAAFGEITKEQWDEYYREQGVEHFLYITNVEGASFDIEEIYQPFPVKTAKTDLEKYLAGKGVEPEVIYNKERKEVFYAYSF